MTYQVNKTYHFSVPKDRVEIMSKLKNIDPSKDYSSLDEVLLMSEWRRIEASRLRSLIDRKTCEVGREHSRLFEEACFEILGITLADTFRNNESTIQFQPSSNNIDGYISSERDITLFLAPKQEDNDEHHIWNIFHNVYGIRNLVFECKNYKEKGIGRNQVYQLYEYLSSDDPEKYKEGNGRLGFLLTRHGKKSLDNYGTQAILRLKKDKYNILVLGDKELLKIIDQFESKGNAIDCFRDFYSEYTNPPVAPY